MSNLIYIFDLDQTLIDRFSSEKLFHIEFDKINQIRKASLKRGHNCYFGVLSNSCFESVDKILDVSQLSVFDFLFFENGAVKVEKGKAISNFPEEESFEAVSKAIQTLEKENQSLINMVSYKHFTIAVHLVNPTVRCSITPKINEILPKHNWASKVSHSKVLELSPSGLEKTYGLQQILKVVPSPDKIYFIGDQMHPDGNDYPLAIDEQIDVAIEVRNVMDTDHILTNLLNGVNLNCDYELLARTTARIVNSEHSDTPLKTIKQKIEHVFLDFDGTLTLNQSQIYFRNIEVIQKLKSSGKSVWIVTGRSWGWCDMLVQTLPIDGIIGENGAFALYWVDGYIKKWKSSRVDNQYKEKLSLLKAQISDQLPDSHWASDQQFREYDLAVVTNENTIIMPESDQKTLTDLAKKNGARYALSSIHINIWFGEYEKAISLVDFMQKVHDTPTQVLQKVGLFIGDSPNDEPIFRLLDFCFSVSNIREFLPLLKYPPKYISNEHAGLGAFEILNELAEECRERRDQLFSGKTKKIFSVVIPCFKEMDKLENTIKSFLVAADKFKQDNNALVELILVDNNSPESSSIASFAQKYRESMNLLVVQQPKLDSTFSLCEARNRGVLNSTGKYIFFTDSDCMVDPDFFGQLESFVQTKREEEKWILTGERVFVRTPVNIEINELNTAFFDQLERVPSASNYGLIKDRRFPWIENLPNQEHPWNFVHGCFMLMTKSIYMDIGGSDTQYDGHWGYEEIELIHELVSNSHASVYYLDQAKVYHQEFEADLQKLNENQARSNKKDNPNWNRICTKIKGFSEFKEKQFATKNIDTDM